jgi:deoxyribodipyrimidine photo-lyase
MAQNRTKQAPALVWFRQDLRLSDHRPLVRALEHAETILAVYVHDVAAAGQWAPGGAGRWWLHHSLVSLDKALRKAGGKLVLRQGDAAAIIPELAREAGVSGVHCGLSHEPWLRALDTRVAEALAREQIGFHAHRVATLFDLGSIRTKTGGVYGVYTPFANTCRGLPDPEPPLPAPERIPAARGKFVSDRIEDWGLLPTKPDWAGGMRSTWQPGEAGAHDRLTRFLADHLDDYGARRDLPADEDGTSMLSPHLHWGEISAVQVWHAAQAAHTQPRTRQGFERFTGELLWHEFAAYLLWHNPSLPEQPMRAAFTRLPWRDDPKSMRAWQRGRTGVPIVDAGMRQLWQIGWMHNRVRMITASLLVKHLLVSWQDGEAWFWDTLVDGDLATNSASWQWVAGSGTDSQPFFRIFNPVTQSKKFDPAGVYIRRWVPELAKLPNRLLHAPWEAPAAELAKAGVSLGKTYPRPVVALEEGRDRALAAFREQVRGGTSGAAPDRTNDAA